VSIPMESVLEAQRLVRRIASTASGQEVYRKELCSAVLALLDGTLAVGGPEHRVAIRSMMRVVKNDPTAMHPHDSRVRVMAVWPCDYKLDPATAPGHLEVVLGEDDAALFPVGHLFTMEMQTPPKTPTSAREET
jgi:hypothetical protein